MKKTAILSLVIVFVFSITAFAQWRDRGPSRMSGKRGMMRLNLTEEQKNSLKELRQNWSNERRELSKNLREASRELRKLMKEKSPNEFDINRKLDKINSTKADLSKKRIKFSLENRKIFTDEQWGKLQKVKKFMRGRGMMEDRRMHSRRLGGMNKRYDYHPRFYSEKFNMRRNPHFGRGQFYNPHLQEQPRLQRPQRPGFDRGFDREFGGVFIPELDELVGFDFAPDFLDEDFLIEESNE